MDKIILLSTIVFFQAIYKIKTSEDFLRFYAINQPHMSYSNVISNIFWSFDNYKALVQTLSESKCYMEVVTFSIHTIFDVAS